MQRSGGSLQPALERTLALSGSLPREQVGDADVLIQVGPVDPLAAADEVPPLALLGGRVCQPRIPEDGTETVRPSSNSTVSATSVTSTRVAIGTATSVVEELI